MEYHEPAGQHLQNRAVIGAQSSDRSPLRYRAAIFVRSPFARALRYLLLRMFSISLTIFAGVFLTILIINRGGILDKEAQKQVDRNAILMRYSGMDPAAVEAKRIEMEKVLGLSDPFLKKHLRYTIKALGLKWGQVWDHRKFGDYIVTSAGIVGTDDARQLILSKLPNTLLLTGVAYLLLALIGIPLAMFLSEREGHWLDRLTGFLTPISSVPSWVLGVLLVMVFAVQFKVFPVGKMYDIIPASTPWEEVVVVARHLFLPVTAIVLSLFFQLVSNWRTFLMIYSQEDYVTLALAKGLKRGAIEMQYILRPVFPYILTSFVLTLVGFWQTITALEYFFQWPGIGAMYVDALPNFNGESMYAGEMIIVIGIVVLFAYLLGLAVFVLDFMYVLADPRLRLGSQQQKAYPILHEKQRRRGGSLKTLFNRASANKSPARQIRPPIQNASGNPVSQAAARRMKRPGASRPLAELKRILREIWQVPGAVVGLGLVFVLLIGSIIVVIKIPYDPIGKEWALYNLTGNPIKAKLAQPTWVNWFLADDLPSTIVLNSQDGTAAKKATMDAAGNPLILIEFSLDYPYRTFPSEMALYMSSKYSEKMPFATFTWITPDGREIQLKNAAIPEDLAYSFEDGISMRRELVKFEHYKSWFISTGDYATPSFYLLFADPQAEEARALPGKYSLRLTGLTFEKGSDLDAQLVIFGQVEGWAGTDYVRRDLGIPLLWGLPFALLIGVLGAVTTTLLSLVIAAASAWLGGWVDGLIQRAIEANLILPVMAVGVLFYAYYGFNLWLILGLIVLLNVFGSPTKAFRAAFLQVKQSEYIDAALAYGASTRRIIFRYLIPRIIPVVIPQIVILIPNFFFLEATLAIFNISDPRYPTWGRVIYSAIRYGAAYGSRFWVLEPIAMMLLTGLAFALLGFALNRILNPQLDVAK